MQTRSASRGSQYIRGTRPKDRLQQQQQQHTQAQGEQGVYQGYYDVNSASYQRQRGQGRSQSLSQVQVPERTSRYYSQDNSTSSYNGQYAVEAGYGPNPYEKPCQKAEGQYQAYSPQVYTDTEDETVYLPSLGTFQSLHSLVDNGSNTSLDRQASASTVAVGHQYHHQQQQQQQQHQQHQYQHHQRRSASAAGIATRPMSRAVRSDSYYSNASPVASRSNSSLDRPASAVAQRSVPLPARPAPTVVTQRLPSTVRSGDSYYSNASPAASSSTTSLDRPASSAVAYRAVSGALPPRPMSTAVRTDSYPNASPVASASTSSLDRQLPAAHAQRSASTAVTPRPPSSAIAQRSISTTAVPRPASAAVRGNSYYGGNASANPGIMARRNTIVFDADQTKQQTPPPIPAPTPAPTETVSKPPRFYASIRASTIATDPIQTATVEEETTTIRLRQSVYGGQQQQRQSVYAQRQSVYSPQPRPRSSRRSQWPRGTSRLFSNSPIPDITDSDEGTDKPESRASLSCPSLLPANQESASSTTLSTPKTSGEDYKSQYRKTKSFPLEKAPTSTPTTGQDGEREGRKLVKRNPSAGAPQRPHLTARSMSLANAPPMPTSAPPSPPPLPRAMSVHLPRPLPTATATDKAKKPRLASLWSGLFRLRVSN
ncbi:hypothetical protein FQN49_008268 [Arthroderma sp. PD_2]|nr:hypothetical protein FQN49_008268 [Arthroderma sp. PD_2]